MVPRRKLFRMTTEQASEGVVFLVKHLSDWVWDFVWDFVEGD